MKRSMVLCVVLVIGLMFVNSGCAKSEVSLKTQKDKVSYSIGWDIGSSFQKQSIEVDTEVFINGFKEALASKEPKLTSEEMREILNTFQQELQEKMMQKRTESTGKNIEEGKKFLEANKKKKGVKTTESGLQYKVLKEGTGKRPSSSDTVEVHYCGTTIDGTEFDSSYSRGTPASFPVTGVIPGWTEALQLMKVGAEYELYIPSDLAYGERGAGQQIGPNAALIFKVELISIK